MGGRRLAGTLAAVLVAGCGGTELEGTGPDPVAVPADVNAPLLRCTPDVGTIPILLPCRFGQPSVSEVDCALGGFAAGQTIRFVLPQSLPEVTGAAPLTLGAPTRFDAREVPGARSPVLGERYLVIHIWGTVTFTQYSPLEQTLDGWFPHLDVVAVGRTGDVGGCTLDQGRFTAVPGDFL